MVQQNYVRTSKNWSILPGTATPRGDSYMRSRLIFAVLFLASLQAFSQNFAVLFTGGNVTFGKAPLNVVVTPNTSGTKGIATSAPGACGAIQAVTLNGGPNAFFIRGKATVGGRQLEVVFKFRGGANQGNLSAASSNWELTGKYEMAIKDVTTNAVCSTVVGASGEYQFGGPPLAGWPKLPGKPCNAKGQSPMLTGTLALHGHANIFPKFVSGGKCTSALAKEAKIVIGGKGFDAVSLDYQLSY
jgi:hypothetical protein